MVANLISSYPNCVAIENSTVIIFISIGRGKLGKWAENATVLQHKIQKCISTSPYLRVIHFEDHIVPTN